GGREGLGRRDREGAEQAGGPPALRVVGNRRLLERAAGFRRFRQKRAGELDRDDQGSRDRTGMTSIVQRSSRNRTERFDVEGLELAVRHPTYAWTVSRLRPRPPLPSVA